METFDSINLLFDIIVSKINIAQKFFVLDGIYDKEASNYDTITDASRTMLQNLRDSSTIIPATKTMLLSYLHINDLLNTYNPIIHYESALLAQLSIGSYIIIWMRSLGHAFSIGVHRKSDDNTDVYFFNSGDGIQMHPRVPDRKYDDDIGKYGCFLIKRNVPYGNIENFCKMCQMYYTMNNFNNLYQQSAEEVYDLLVSYLFLNKNDYNPDGTKKVGAIYFEDVADDIIYLYEQTTKNCTGRAILYHLIPLYIIRDGLTKDEAVKKFYRFKTLYSLHTFTYLLNELETLAHGKASHSLIYGNNYTNNTNRLLEYVNIIKSLTQLYKNDMSEYNFSASEKKFCDAAFGRILRDTDQLVPIVYKINNNKFYTKDNLIDTSSMVTRTRKFGDVRYKIDKSDIAVELPETVSKFDEFDKLCDEFMVWMRKINGYDKMAVLLMSACHMKNELIKIASTITYKINDTTLIKKRELSSTFKKLLEISKMYYGTISQIKRVLVTSSYSLLLAICVKIFYYYFEIRNGAGNMYLPVIVFDKTDARIAEFVNSTVTNSLLFMNPSDDNLATFMLTNRIIDHDKNLSFNPNNILKNSNATSNVDNRAFAKYLYEMCKCSYNVLGVNKHLIGNCIGYVNFIQRFLVNEEFMNVGVDFAVPIEINSTYLIGQYFILGSGEIVNMLGKKFKDQIQEVFVLLKKKKYSEKRVNEFLKGLLILNSMYDLFPINKQFIDLLKFYNQEKLPYFNLISNKRLTDGEIFLFLSLIDTKKDSSIVEMHPPVIFWENYMYGHPDAQAPTNNIKQVFGWAQKNINSDIIIAMQYFNNNLEYIFSIYNQYSIIESYNNELYFGEMNEFDEHDVSYSAVIYKKMDKYFFKYAADLSFNEDLKETINGKIHYTSSDRNKIKDFSNLGGFAEFFQLNLLSQYTFDCNVERRVNAIVAVSDKKIHPFNKLKIQKSTKKFIGNILNKYIVTDAENKRLLPIFELFFDRTDLPIDAGICEDIANFIKNMLSFETVYYINVWNALEFIDIELPRYKYIIRYVKVSKKFFCHTCGDKYEIVTSGFDSIKYMYRWIYGVANIMLIKHEIFGIYKLILFNNNKHPCVNQSICYGSIPAYEWRTSRDDKYFFNDSKDDDKIDFKYYVISFNNTYSCIEYDNDHAIISLVYTYLFYNKFTEVYQLLNIINGFMQWQKKENEKLLKLLTDFCRNHFDSPYLYIVGAKMTIALYVDNAKKQKHFLEFIPPRFSLYDIEHIIQPINDWRLDFSKFNFYDINSLSPTKHIELNESYFSIVLKLMELSVAINEDTNAVLQKELINKYNSNYEKKKLIIDRSYFIGYPHINREIITTNSTIPALRLVANTYYAVDDFDSNPEMREFIRRNKVEMLPIVNADLRSYNHYKFTDDNIREINSNIFSPHDFSVLSGNLLKDYKLIEKTITNKTYIDLIQLYQEMNSMSTESEKAILRNEIARRLKTLQTGERKLDAIYFMFEFIFGYYIKKEQIDLIEKIYKQFTTDNDNRKFHQLLMGAGKTSVVSPLLNLKLILNNPKKFTLNILPESLVDQSLKILTKTLSYVFSIPVILYEVTRATDLRQLVFESEIVYIMSDSSYKAYILQAQSYKAHILQLKKERELEEPKEPKESDDFKPMDPKDAFVIMDEVDTVGDTIKCETNYPIIDKAAPPRELNIANSMFIFDLLQLFNESKSKNLIKNPNTMLKDKSLYKDVLTEHKKEIYALLDTFLQLKEKEMINGYIKDSPTRFDAIVFENSNPLKKFDDTDPDKYKHIIEGLYFCNILFRNLLRAVLSKRYRLNFGFVNDTDDENYSYHFISIPYNALDIPSYNQETKVSSEFANASSKMCYTIAAYFAEEKFRKRDYYKLLETMKNDHSIEKMLMGKYSSLQTTTEKLYNKFALACGVHTSFDDTHPDLFDPNKKIPSTEFYGMLKYYVTKLFIQYIKEMNKAMNCSFTDLIFRDVSFFTSGFTGTPYLFIPYVDRDKKDYTIELNAEDEGKIVSGLTNKFTGAKFVSIEKPIEILEKLNGYDTLIDVGAYFLKESAFDVIKMIRNRLFGEKQFFIFIDKDHIKKYITVGSDVSIVFNESIPLRGRFIYFDQAHCTGQDARLLPGAKGLATIAKDTTYRDMAQGAFRLRKLGYGQTIDYITTNEILRSFESNQSKFIKMLKNTDSKSMENKNKMGLVQNIRSVHKFGVHLTEENPFTIQIDNFDIKNNEDFIKNTYDLSAEKYANISPFTKWLYGKYIADKTEIDGTPEQEQQQEQESHALIVHPSMTFIIDRISFAIPNDASSIALYQKDVTNDLKTLYIGKFNNPIILVYVESNRNSLVTNYAHIYADMKNLLEKKMAIIHPTGIIIYNSTGKPDFDALDGAFITRLYAESEIYLNNIQFIIDDIRAWFKISREKLSVEATGKYQSDLFTQIIVYTNYVTKFGSNEFSYGLMRFLDVILIQFCSFDDFTTALKLFITKLIAGNFSFDDKEKTLARIIFNMYKEINRNLVICLQFSLYKLFSYANVTLDDVKKLKDKMEEQLCAFVQNTGTPLVINVDKDCVTPPNKFVAEIFTRVRKGTINYVTKTPIASPARPTIGPGPPYVAPAAPTPSYVAPDVVSPTIRKKETNRKTVVVGPKPPHVAATLLSPTEGKIHTEEYHKDSEIGKSMILSGFGIKKGKTLELFTTDKIPSAGAGAVQYYKLIENKYVLVSRDEIGSFFPKL